MILLLSVNVPYHGNRKTFLNWLLIVKNFNNDLKKITFSSVFYKLFVFVACLLAE